MVRWPLRSMTAPKQLKVYYGNSGQTEYTFTPDFSGSASCIGVMADGNGTYPYAAQVVSITFQMKKLPDDEPSSGNAYPAESLKAYERWSNTPVALTEGKLILSYSKQWEEYCLDLPKALDLSACENITIKTADQNATLAFKVYDGAKAELKVYYGNSGKNEYSFVPDYNGKAACIGFMCSDENTVKTDDSQESNNAFESPRTVQIVSIEFTMNGEVEEILWRQSDPESELC